MSSSVSSPTTHSVVRALFPLKVAVLVAFLAIGLALPVLPLHVRDALGFGPIMVGTVAGFQFAAALLARIWSGEASDGLGPKWAVIAGLVGSGAAGLLYLISLAATSSQVSVGILLAGRAVLGGAESFVITGAVAWGLARVGPRHAGKVIAWMGTAMFLGFAAGAPLGSLLYSAGGFAAVAAGTIVVPILTVLMLWPVVGGHVPSAGRPNVLTVARTVWRPGLAAAFSSVGYGAILAFGSLLFAHQSWSPVWLAFSAYALALILARLLFGHLPDRFGGARVALGSILIECLGLVVMGLAPSGGIAALGAALTGFGYSLVFPGLGVEAVRLAPPESRGVAMAAYTACLDLALGVSGPLLGLVASGAGYGTVFLVSATFVLGATLFTVPLLAGPRRSSHG